MNPFSRIEQVDAQTAFERWQREEVALVDVREQEEWDLGHIDGIELIPLGQLPWRWRELDAAKKWICVCRSGSRSNYAAALLAQAGVEAANLEGGMLEWKRRGLPITPPGVVDSH